MINAFLYLQLTTVRNALVQRLKRLKQPKYLVGALAGLAYFYFFLFSRALQSPRSRSPMEVPLDVSPHLVYLGALFLFLVVAATWVLPAGRAALQFTEAEVAFLFPAPVTRRRLIHFKLLRSQLGILLSVVILSLIFRRASALGGSPFTHAAGWWIMLSTLNLHLLGASFAREQLLDLGLNPARRRLVAGAVLAALGYGCWWWLRRQVAPPGDGDFVSIPAVIRYAGGVLQHPPLGWVLAPFALVVRPFFAADHAGFFLALGPALLLLAAHYWWVLRADVSFEEASIDQARKTAELVAAVRAGDWRAGRTPTKARPAPFRLAATGVIAVAFLWKNLIALGPFFRLRTWLIFAAVITGFHVWAAATHLDRLYYAMTAIIPLSFGGWLLIAGPMIMRRDLRLMITHFDLLKSYPLRGWQVVLGSLLPPLVVLAAVEWLLLLLGAPSTGLATRKAALAAGVLGTGSLGIALVLPPLAGLMLSIPFAATLYFPAWADSAATRGGGGVEVVGQRLIFFAGYIIVLLVALVPAVLCGGLAAFIVHWLAGTVAAIVAIAVVAGLILAAEFAAVVWWLGERYEHFDLSQEMPR